MKARRMILTWVCYSKNALFLLLLAGVNLPVAAQQKGFDFKERPDEKKLELLYDGKLVTAYYFHDSVRKPILYPVITPGGITVTRGFPIEPRPGERTDHPHHTGVWLNYESVNGLDFWNNSPAIPVERRNRYGTILHRSIERKRAGRNSALLQTTSSWVGPSGKEILQEKTAFRFGVEDEVLVIDRNTELKAEDEEVVFRDVKDGFFAIRVARELEMPSGEKSGFVNEQGKETPVPAIANESLAGMYESSCNVRGDSVWSSKADWVLLKGSINGQPVTVGIIDHPDNIGYPTYWHARGYGLFAANPLGQKIFSNGKEELNLRLQPGETVNFRFRLVTRSGKEITRSEMDELARDFARSKD